MSQDKHDKHIRIVRAVRCADQPYFMMRRDAAQNRELSWEARGMLAYLLSKPDDWEVRIADLQQGCGRDKVYSILRELERAGHLIRIQERLDNQRFSRLHYIVHETPASEEPRTEKPERDPSEPLTDLPYVAKPTLHSIENNKERESIGAPSVAPGDAPQEMLSGKKDKQPASKAKGGAATKTPRARDPLFDCIAQCAFGLALDDPAVIKVFSGRIARIVKALRDFEFRDHKPAPDALQTLSAELRAAYAWHPTRSHEPLSLPQGTTTTIQLLRDYRAERQRQAQAYTPEHRPTIWEVKSPPIPALPRLGAIASGLSPAAPDMVADPDPTNAPDAEDWHDLPF